MKRLLITLLALALMTSANVYALVDTKECTITLNVPTDFYLDLGATWIDFGTVIDGQSTVNKSLLINTVSSTGNDWELRFKNTPLAIEINPAVVIADSNCYVQFNKDAAATGTSPYATTGNFPGGTDTVLYDSSAGETGALYHSAALSVYVPVAQPAGWYKSVITFTMIEA